MSNVLVGEVTVLYKCSDCDGKISRYHAELRVCQDCKKIVNLGELLNLLRNLGVTEPNVQRIEDNLTFPKIFAL